MRIILAVFITLALASPAAAQALNEPFNYGTTSTFPPTGWTNSVLQGSDLGWDEPSIMATSNNWSTLTADAAGHDDYGSASSTRRR